MQEAQELVEFGLAESAGHVPLELAHLRHQRLELPGARFGERDALAAAITCRAASLYQARALEPIQQRHDARLVHPEVGTQFDLRDTWIGAHQAQQTEQPRTDFVLADEADVSAPGGLVGASQVVTQKLWQWAEVDLGAGGALAPGGGRTFIAYPRAVTPRLFH